MTKNAAKLLWVGLGFLMHSGYGFTQNAVETLRQFRGANLAGVPPQDVTMWGTVTDEFGKSQPVQVQIKGKDKIRYQTGEGKTLQLTIFNGTQGWAQIGDQLKAIPEHSGVRRPSLIPMLDLPAEIDNPRFIVEDLGLKVIDRQNARHLSLLLPDDAPVRPFGRKLDERLEVFFDPTTRLVVRTDRLNRAQEDMDFFIPLVMEYSDYRVVGNLAIPFRVVSTSGTPRIGIHQKLYVISQVQLNSNISDSVFRPASGGQR